MSDLTTTRGRFWELVAEVHEHGLYEQAVPKLEKLIQSHQRYHGTLARRRKRRADGRRNCRLCGRLMRSNCTQPYCGSCQKTAKDACPDCGRPKGVLAKHCQSCQGKRAHQAYVKIAAKRSGSPRPKRTSLGRCRGRYWETGTGGVRFEPNREGLCSRARWANLDHVHCPCGRPMGVDAGSCTRCVARQLEHPPSGHCARCGDQSADPLCEVCVAEIAVRIRRAIRDVAHSFASSEPPSSVAIEGLRV